MSKDIQCPKCDKVLKSQGGLTVHLNAIHLVMSPNQIKEMNKSLPESHKLNEAVSAPTPQNSHDWDTFMDTPVCRKCGETDPSKLCVIAPQNDELLKRVRRVFSGRITKQTSFKVETDDSLPKYKTIVAPYEPTVDKVIALITAEQEKLLDRLLEKKQGYADAPSSDAIRIEAVPVEVIQAERDKLS